MIDQPGIDWVLWRYSNLIAHSPSLHNTLKWEAAFRLIRGGEWILDVISRAGGTASQGHDEWVMLERNGRRAIAPFGALVYEPRNNIYVNAGDTIYLYCEPQTFLTFGPFGLGGPRKHAIRTNPV